MTQEQMQLGIADMQCWVFRKAQRKWKVSPKECAKIFEDNDLLGYISECYDILHLSSYQRVLEDVEEILSQSGVEYDKNSR